MACDLSWQVTSRRVVNFEILSQDFGRGLSGEPILPPTLVARALHSLDSITNADFLENRLYSQYDQIFQRGKSSRPKKARVIYIFGLISQFFDPGNPKIRVRVKHEERCVI